MNSEFLFLFFLIATSVWIPNNSFADSQERNHLWQVWEDIPSENYLKVYLFNVTNPDEFELENKQPIVIEVGPYVFKEEVVKLNVSQSQDHTTASFTEIKTYEFIPEKSKGTENDIVNIFNVPLLTFGKLLGDVPYVGPNYFKSIVKAGERLIRRNERVGDVLYYGIKADPYVKVLTQLGHKIPLEFSENRFGLFKGRNGSSTGNVVIETGITPNSKYGHIFSWKEQKNLTWWGSEQCNKINGTQGNLFDPKYLSKYHISIFDTEACRTLKYSYHGISEEKHHINSFKYIISKDMLEDPRKNPENQCYCAKLGDEADNKFDECYKKGIMDLAPCREGAPLAISLPHFYEADESYVNGVIGMHPEKDLHRTYLIVEPKTGIVLKDVRRFQLNVQLKRRPSLAYFSNVTDILLPVFWMEKTYSVTEEALDIVKLEAEKSPGIGIDEHGAYQPSTEASNALVWKSNLIVVLIGFFRAANMGF